MLKLDRFSCSQKIRLKWDPLYIKWESDFNGLTSSGYQEWRPAAGGVSGMETSAAGGVIGMKTSAADGVVGMETSAAGGVAGMEVL